MSLLKKNLLLCCAVTILLLVSVQASFARNVPLVEGKVSIYLPDSWKNAYDRGVVSTESPDGGVAIVFTLLDNNQVEAAMQEAEASIVEAVGRIRHNGDLLEFTVNGMPATMQKGISLDRQSAFSLTMVLTPAEKWLMIMYLGNKTQEAIWRSYLSDILNGVKPLR
jgi:hypothetical protein